MSFSSMALKSSLASCKVRRCPAFFSRTGVSGKKYWEVLSFDALLQIQFNL